jgi:hypothetical protein
MDFDLTNVKILAAKFGPKDITTYSPDPMSLTSFAGTVRNVTVSYHGDIEELWTLRIIKKEVEVEFTAVDAWAKRIWLYANGRANSELGFKYRKAGDDEWTEVENVTIDGGTFTSGGSNVALYVKSGANVTVKNNPVFNGGTFGI